MIRHTGLIARVISTTALIMMMCTVTWGAGIRIVPSSSVVKPGEDFYFDIVAEGIPASGLGGTQFRLAATPSAGAVNSVADLNQAGVNDIAIVTPLPVSPAVAGRSGMGDFFWNGKGPNGLLMMDNEPLVNGSALYTFAHTSGAQPLSGSGVVARFTARIGSGVKAERLDFALSDVMLMDGGPAYTLDYVTGASVQLRCISNVPALSGLNLTAAQAALTAANLTLGSVYEIDNQNGLRLLNVVLEQSSPTGSELDCKSPVNLAINTPPADPANVAAIDKINDESGTVALAWTPPVASDTAGYRVYSGSAMLKQVAGALTTGTEISGLTNGVATKLRVTAYDAFGNENGGAFVDATPLDDVKPVVALNGVIDGGFYRNDIIPQITATDAGPVTWSAALNGSPFTVASITNDGNYTLTVSAVDQAGNSSSKSISFVVDKTVPTIVVASISDNTFYKAAVSPIVTVSDANIKTSSITLDGQPYLSGTTVSVAGNHALQINVDDLAGNSASQTIHFTIDTTKPILMVSTLSNGSYTNNEVLNIAGTVTDDMGIKTLTINGVVVLVQPDGSFSDALLLVAGANRVEVSVSDLADNTVSDIRTITLDQNAPLIDVTSPADNSKTAQVGLVVTGNVDETSTVEIRLAGNSQPVTMNGESFSAPLTLAQGYNTIEIIATDLAGNRGTEKRTVIFDDQEPSLAITEPGQDIRTNRNVLILKGAVADALTAVTVMITMDGQTYTPVVVNGAFEQRLVLSDEKNYPIQVTATDEVGNAISVTRNVIYDITPPVLVIGPVVSPANQSSAVISGTMEEGSTISIICATAFVGAVEYPTAVTWRAAVSTLTAGVNTITVTAVDIAGNETAATTQIIYDTTPPTGSIVINGGDAFTGSNRVALTLAAVDENGVAQMRFSNDGTSWNDPETFAVGREWSLAGGDGSKQLFVQFMDPAGNWSVEPVVASIVLDMTTPLVTVSPTGGIFKTAQTIQLAANEAATIYYTLDGTTPTTASTVYSEPINIPATATLKFIAVDLAGNRSDVRTDTYVIDLLPPLLSVSTLADGSYTNNEVLNIAGTVSDNTGVKELKINGTLVAIQPDGSYSQALLLTTGSNRIEIVATDLADNSASDVRTVTMDQAAPILVVTVPADNSKTGAALIDVTGSVDETSTVTVALGSSVQTAAMTGSAFTAPLVLAPGYNTIEVTATDLANNRNTLKRTVVYDDQKPSLAVTIPALDIRTNLGGLTIRGTVSDPYTAVTVTITMDGQFFYPPVVNGQFEQAVTFTTEKSYSIQVTAVNEVGSSTSAQRNVIYDITPPSLAIGAVNSPTVLPSQVIGGTREAGIAVTVACPSASIGSVEYPTETTWQAPLAGMRVGDNVITVQAYDVTGNQTVVYAHLAVLTVDSDVSFSVSPNIIWPPSHKMVAVTINGKLNIPDADLQSLEISLTDEYGVYSYRNLKFGSTVLIEAWRDGADPDGRNYTITAVVTRRDGSKTTTTTSVLVPHDMGK